MNSYHLVQINLIKAFAIISVVILHTWPRELVINSYSLFYFWQAVPIFLILMSLNSGTSIKRKGIISIPDLYSTPYFVSKFKRIVLPFIFTFIFALIIGLIASQIKGDSVITFSKYTIVGKLPIVGPGDYFIPLLFQYVLISPLLYYFYKKNNKITIGILFLINIVFELTSDNILPHFSDAGWLYAISLIRYLSALVLGLWLVDNQDTKLRQQPVLMLGIVVSTLYLLYVMFLTDRGIYFSSNFGWGTQNVLSFFYPVLLILLGIKYLPRNDNNLVVKFFSSIGKMSYHIFLMQILFFGTIMLGLRDEYTLIFPSTFAATVVNLCSCILLGFLFFLLDTKIQKTLFK